MLAALAIGYGMDKKLSPMPIFTALVVVTMGGLTLYFKDDAFIKMKPTIVYGFFSAILLGGLMFNSLYIKYAFTIAFELNDDGWRKLTLRWACFFTFLAVLNEVVWRTVSTDTWVSFKVFAIMPLTMVFALSQIGLLKAHEIPAD